MIKECIVVSDTNIFLDLISIDLLSNFFELPCAIHTGDFVINEIIQIQQRNLIQSLVDSGKLTVTTFEFQEVTAITQLQQNCKTNASLTDCSAWYYSKKIGARLLTGDNKLRRIAEEDNVAVSGVLYIFDNLIEYGILEKSTVAKKLKQLVDKNPRLPHKECQKRIDEWSK